MGNQPHVIDCARYRPEGSRPCTNKSIHSRHDPVKDPVALHGSGGPGERENAIQEEAKEGQAAQGVRAEREEG